MKITVDHSTTAWTVQVCRFNHIILLFISGHMFYYFFSYKNMRCRMLLLIFTWGDNKTKAIIEDD